VVAVNRDARAISGATESVALAGVHGVLGGIDHVINTLPATPYTANLIDATFLAALRPDAVVVNVSRGAVLDEAALLAAIDAGQIRGATLDVTHPEPPRDDSPLWTHPRILLTGHRSPAGGRGPGPDAPEVFAENLGHYLAGEYGQLRNRVDLELGY